MNRLIELDAYLDESLIEMGSSGLKRLRRVQAAGDTGKLARIKHLPHTLNIGSESPKLRHKINTSLKRKRGYYNRKIQKGWIPRGADGATITDARDIPMNWRKKPKVSN